MKSKRLLHAHKSVNYDHATVLPYCHAYRMLLLSKGIVHFAERLCKDKFSLPISGVNINGPSSAAKNWLIHVVHSS